MTYNQTDCKQEKFDEQLECLRSNLLTAQEQLKTVETGIKANEEQIKTIEALISKRNQIADDYREAYTGLQTRQNDFEQAGKDEKKCLENILNEKEQKKLRCIVNKERKDIINLENEIQTDINGLDGVCTNGARKDLDVQNKALDEAKKKYELWIDPIKSIESRFKILETIKKEIDKEHTAGNHTYAYYLLDVSDDSFYKHLNEIPVVVEPENLDDKLKAAWDNYRRTDNCFNAVVSKVKSLEKRLEINQAQLTEDKKNLEATIKRRLMNFANEEYKESDCPKDTSEDKNSCSDDESTKT